MKNAIRGILFLLVTLSGTLGATSYESATENVVNSFSAKSGGTLVIESDRGSIKVEPWDQQVVEVSVEKKAKNQKQLDGFKVGIYQKDNGIFVEGDGGRNNTVAVEFIAKVPREYNLRLKTGGGAIGVADIRGDVKANTSGGSIRIGNVTNGSVEAHTSGGSIDVGNVDGNLKVKTSGGSISLGQIDGESSIKTSGGSITMKRGGKAVKAETSGSSIDIGPVGGRVDVRTAGGSIRIGVAGGDVAAKTSGGAIIIKGGKGSVNIVSSGGNLFVGSSGGPVKAKTSGGDIKILKARGFIEARTSGGNIAAEMIADDNNADTHVNLESSGGSLRLHIPRTLASSVSATLKITRSARGGYRIHSDFPLTVKGEGSRKITAKGDLNQGGDKISLSTTNGDIDIKILAE